MVRDDEIVKTLSPNTDSRADFEPPFSFEPILSGEGKLMGNGKRIHS